MGICVSKEEKQESIYRSSRVGLSLLILNRDVTNDR